MKIVFAFSVLMDVDAGNRPLAERLEALLDNDKAADVVFVVGDPQKTTPIRIPAISGLLIAASDAFKAMFIGEFPRASEVSVPDGDPDTFQIMLRYMYTDNLKLELDCALPVMYHAKKYMLTRLIAEATELVSTLLSTENVCQLLSYIGLVEETSEKCWKMVDKQTPAVLKSTAFLACDSKTVAEILPKDTLHVLEVDVFQALVDWASDELKRQSKELSVENIREAMGELLFLVRFPLMRAQEFTAAHDQCAVLTNEETLSVYKYFATCLHPEWFSCASRSKKRSHFSITFPLTDFRAFAKGPDEFSRVSEPVGNDDLTWSIMSKLATDDTGKKVLGFHLQCECSTDECSWSRRADATMRVRSYRAQTRDIIRRTDVRAYSDNENWGYTSFAEIQDLLNPSKGFLHDDTILMSVDVFPQPDEPSQS